ncbi:uncharacterized protein AB675_10472 [Cyphellophora attinorum]|uniref:Uncharacterized protein n=1 Tax=Cyphellophora attinorum TaxID=1664694 RepID=A0A0N1H382_9EURO|nr:uncharacterized protein AB675_10472 [Phialophora attinorum]KPI35937.1 hypothetical protein AB675_10472 [Phialophora attinorum]
MGGFPSPLVRVVEYALSSPTIMRITDIVLTSALFMIFVAAGFCMVDFIKHLRAWLQEEWEAAREEEERGWELELAIKEMELQRMRAVAARDDVREDQLATLEEKGEEDKAPVEGEEEAEELEKAEEEPEQEKEQQAAERTEKETGQHDEKVVEHREEQLQQSEMNDTAADPEKHLEQKEEEQHPNTGAGLSTRHEDRSHSLYRAYPFINMDDHEYDSDERDETYDGTHACPALWEREYLRRERRSEEREEARDWDCW